MFSLAFVCAAKLNARRFYCLANNRVVTSASDSRWVTFVRDDEAVELARHEALRGDRDWCRTALMRVIAAGR